MRLSVAQQKYEMNFDLKHEFNSNLMILWGATIRPRKDRVKLDIRMEMLLTENVNITPNVWCHARAEIKGQFPNKRGLAATAQHHDPSRISSVGLGVNSGRNSTQSLNSKLISDLDIVIYSNHGFQYVSCETLLKALKTTRQTNLAGCKSPSQMAHTSPRVRMALAWIETFTDWNLSAIYSFVTQSSDFSYHYLPSSAGIAPKSMAEWKIYNQVHKMVLPDLKVCHVVEFRSSSTWLWKQFDIREVYECSGIVITRVCIWLSFFNVDSRPITDEW